MNNRILLLRCCVCVFLAFVTNDLSAQCSRGGGSRGGGPPSGSSESLAMSGNPSLVAAMSNSRQSYVNDQAIAMRNQILQYQRQLIAMRHEQSRRQYQADSERQQELLAMRRARADEKRARRAERLAANVARRNAARGLQTDSNSGSALVSFVAPNPFDR